MNSKLKKLLLITCVIAIVAVFYGTGAHFVSAQPNVNDPGGATGRNDPGGGIGTNDPGGAVGENDPGGASGGLSIPNPFIADSLIDLLEVIINEIVMPIGAIVAVLFIIYAGFLFVTAQGSEAKITKAKHVFLYTVIGAAILLGSWAIANAIKNVVCELRDGDLPGLDCQ